MLILIAVDILEDVSGPQLNKAQRSFSVLVLMGLFFLSLSRVELEI